MPILSWYLASQFLTLIGLPVAFATLRHLPSRGYAVAKALGLLLTGVLFWWGGILHVWPNSSGAVLGAAAIVLAGGLVLMRGHWREVPLWWQRHRRYVIVVELLFLTALVVWALVRASQPNLQTAGGEKWMEIAFLNAHLRADFFPPHDPWLSGYAISYYYLGYLLMSLLTRLTVMVPTVAFNVGNAGWYALVAVQVYSLVYDLTGGRGLYRSLVGPLMLLVTGNGVGLLEVLHARGLLPAAFWRWLGIGRLAEPPSPPFPWVPQRFFWWWQASRTLQDVTPWGDSQEVIDEFPAFSFLLGDMHPHLLALPFVLLAVALALHAYRHAAAGSNATDEAAIADQSPRSGIAVWLSGLTLSRLPSLVGYGLVLGALGFLNTWDFPIYWALLVGAWVLGRYTHAETSRRSLFSVLWHTVPEAVVLGIFGVGFYAPFWIGLRSQAGGILPNLFNATKLHQFVVMFLPLLVPVIGVVVGAARRRRIKGSTILLMGAGLVVGIAIVALVIGALAAYPYLMMILRGESVQGYTLAPEAALEAALRRVQNPLTALLLAIGVAAALLSFVKGHASNTAATPSPAVTDAGTPPARRGADDAFPLLLALLGLLLTLAPEFVYLQDIFMTRMNTVFKFYFQAWVLWSLAGAWQITIWFRRLSERAPRRVWTDVGLALSALGIAIGMIYTVLAIPARAREMGVPWTLDGAAWLAQSYPDDAAAIQWLNAHVTGAPVIVEAPGDQHRAYIYEGRVAALTGLPTLLGWGGHELQWRGNYDVPAQREVDLMELYTTTDPMVAQAILDRYDVAYVYVGPVERQRYPTEGLAKFDEMFPPVYKQDAVAIYEIVSQEAATTAP